MKYLIEINEKREFFSVTDYSKLVKEVEKKYGKGQSFDVLDVKY